MRSSLLRPRFRPLELRPAVVGGELVDDPVQALALEHAGQVADGQPDAVVGHPVLREVVGADALGAVQRADLRAALGRELSLLLGDGPVEQAGAEHAQGLLAVLDLRLLVLHGDDDPGGQVGHAHRRVGGVDGLATRAGRAVHVDLEVGRVDVDVDLLGLGQDVHAGRGGVDAPLRLGHGDPLDAVHARLELEPGPRALAVDGENDLLEPALEAGQALGQDLDLVAVLLGPARVHAVQLSREQRGLVAACARADLDDHVLVIVGVPWRQRLLQLALDLGDALLGRAQLVLDQGICLLYLIEPFGKHFVSSYLPVSRPRRRPPRYPPPGRSSGWPTACGLPEPSTTLEGSGSTLLRSASGRTCSRARMATSIWSSLGGLVVSICNHSPGFMTALTRPERSRPAPSRMPS